MCDVTAVTCNKISDVMQQMTENHGLRLRGEILGEIIMMLCVCECCNNCNVVIVDER